MAYSKYKDEFPEVTIQTIKNCFKSIGIELEERVIKKMNGIYSCTIIDNKNGWTAAGKGTTEKYCLASGYAEAMEHFCNYCAYDTTLLPIEVVKYHGFYRYPDEIIHDINNLNKVNQLVYNDIKEAFELENDIFTLDQAVIAWKEFLNSNKIFLVPYYSVKNDEITYLPEAIIGKMCGSTGGGAGNTPEEAIGHALDEISERYVKYIIYSQKLTPPDISKEFIKIHCSELYETILSIENGGNYKILVKDASLGKGYPVLAVCLINQSRQSYIVNFGAHPTFAVALERCLTEMFQFISLDNINENRHKQMAVWTSFENGVYSIKNWTSLLRDDTGCIPIEFFGGNFSWEFKPWGFFKVYNNKMGVNQQINNFLKNNVKDIFIRNFSFLGFPVFRVYIPEISCSHFTINEKTMVLFKKSIKLVNEILNGSIYKLKSNELELLKNALSNNTYISTWIFRSINEKYIDLLYAALVKEEDGEECAIPVLKRINTGFSKALIEEQNMKKKGFSIEERNRMVNMFYGKCILEIVQDWRKENPFISIILSLKELGIISDREKGPYLESIQYTHCNYKNVMCRNIPSQQLIRNMLSRES